MYNWRIRVNFPLCLDTGLFFMWFLICFRCLTPQQKEPYEVAPLESLRFENSYYSKKPDSSVLVSDQSTVFECYMHPPLISFAIYIYIYTFQFFLILSVFLGILCIHRVFGAYVCLVTHLHIILYCRFLYTHTLISSVL
jgi:hypothetical protein